jgi:hypothetical protein
MYRTWNEANESLPDTPPPADLTRPTRQARHTVSITQSPYRCANLHPVANHLDLERHPLGDDGIQSEYPDDECHRGGIGVALLEDARHPPDAEIGSSHGAVVDHPPSTDTALAKFVDPRQIPLPKTSRVVLDVTQKREDTIRLRIGVPGADLAPIDRRFT